MREPLSSYFYLRQDAPLNIQLLFSVGCIYLKNHSKIVVIRLRQSIIIMPEADLSPPLNCRQVWKSVSSSSSSSSSLGPVPLCLIACPQPGSWGDTATYESSNLTVKEDRYLLWCHNSALCIYLWPLPCSLCLPASPTSPPSPLLPRLLRVAPVKLQLPYMMLRLDI